MIDLRNVTYQGPPLDDEEILGLLPLSYSSLLRQVNGFILLGGVLHVRGACHAPSWHSIRNTFWGDLALHKLYAVIAESDIPFGQDCVGDQFVLRKEIVHRLAAETGTIEDLKMTLDNFMMAAWENPDELLTPEPLYKLKRQGTILQPGQLIHAFPPFCIKTQSSKISLRPISSDDLISSHASLAQQLANVPEGQKIRFVVDS